MYFGAFHDLQVPSRIYCQTFKRPGPRVTVRCLLGMDEVTDGWTVDVR